MTRSQKKGLDCSRCSGLIVCYETKPSHYLGKPLWKLISKKTVAIPLTN